MLSTRVHQDAMPGFQTELDKKVSASSFRSPLSREQEMGVDALYDTVEADMEGHPELKSWCTRTTLKRYLVARQWDQAAAAKMLRATFEWRKSYRPDLITYESVKEEGVTGKQYICSSPDKEGRPVIVMIPRKENTKPSDQQMRHLVYHLEAASRKADETGVTKMTWLIDFKGYSMRTAPPVRMQIQTTQMLQNHYPERLGLAVCYHAPRLFSFAYRAVRPFIDPITSRKIMFADSAAVMEEKFDMTQLETCIGGSSDWTFDLDAYSQQMQKEEGDRMIGTGVHTEPAQAS